MGSQGSSDLWKALKYVCRSVLREKEMFMFKRGIKRICIAFI
jgi:hypothetical protein